MVRGKKIKDELESLGATIEEIENLTDTEALECINKVKGIDTMTIENHAEPPKESVSTVPSYNSPEWEPYVMAQFMPEELANGIYPKLVGLRRIAPLVLGDLYKSAPVSMKVDYPDGPGVCGRATCQYEVVIAWKVGLPDHALGLMGVADLPLVTFGAIGSASSLNTDDFMKKYCEAIAESRAEARALRKALRLSTVSADEITREDMKKPVDAGTERCVSPETDVPTKITTSQVTAIKNLCKKLQIDVQKFINIGSGKYDRIEDVPYDKALIMVRELNNYQSSDRDSVKAIPDSIKVSS